MIRCKSCGTENSPESRFCEDCGAQVASGDTAAVAVAVREGPLAVGQVLDGRLRIDDVVESGRLNRYRVTPTDQPDADSLLVLEAPKKGEGSLLAAQGRLLDPLEHAGLFRPSERFATEDFDYAAGPWPGSCRLDEQVSSSGALSAEEVIHLGQRLLSIVEVLHQNGILARAIQPGRIWLDEDLFPILDCWDRATTADAPLDEEACVTPGFSAPELYGIGTLDERADLFSLGAVLYFALTGKRADLESRESFFSFPRPATTENGPLVDAIMRAVAKSPGDRFARVEDMREALTRAAAGEPIAPPPAPKPLPAATPPAAPPRAAVAPVAVGGTVVALKSDIGCVRSINQDACLELRFRSFEKSQPRDAHLVAVIDGMGGEAEGDKAASLALRSIAHEVVTTFLSLQDGRGTNPLLPTDRIEKNRFVLQKALEQANRNIFDYASLDLARRGMGCTITACLIDGDTAVYAHAGDTRGYHFRDQLEQVTTDHSLVGRLVALGSMTPEEARTSSQRSIIYRAMGTNPEIEVDLYERKLEPGDLIVLCSDGIWEYYEAGELADIVRAAASPEELCDRLVSICLSRGADDNATVAVIRV